MANGVSKRWAEYTGVQRRWLVVGIFCAVFFVVTVVAMLTLVGGRIWPTTLSFACSTFVFFSLFRASVKASKRDD